MTPEALDSLSKPDLIALVVSQGEQLAVLQARVTELEARLDVPPKTPDNSSLPPSTGQKANVRAKSRKRRRKGRPGMTRQLAENPDEVRDVFAGACSGCGREVPHDEQGDVHAYDHIELPPIKPVVTRIHLHRGTCSCCGTRVIAKAPADMPPGSPFGPGIVALVVYLHTRHMVSYNRLVEIMKALFGLDISEGAISNMLQRAATPFAAEGARIEAMVRNAPVIASDETTARVMGHTCWQWVFSSATAVSHRIAGTRAKAVVEDFLRTARPDVWISDRYGGQLGHGELQQACLAHISRDTQYAIDAGDTVFAPDFKVLIKRAQAIGRRREKLKDGTLKKHNRDFEGRLARLLAREPSVEAGRKFRRAMEKARDMLFVFITRRDVPATNNISEQRLRMSVIFRKVTGCFRSEWGARLYADILSVTATAAIHDQNALEAIRSCLNNKPALQPA